METCERSETRRFLEKAIGFFRDSGKEETLAQIADPQGPFIQGRRYVFALSRGGDLLAHPYSKELMGKNLADLRDSEGTDFIRKLLGKARNRDSGSVEYKWPAPSSSENLDKTLFFERVDGMILCSGFYTEEENSLEALCKCFRPYGPA